MGPAGDGTVQEGWAGELVHLFRRLRMTSAAGRPPPSLREIARRSGYVPSHVRDILNGTGHPSPEAVVAVAGALDASADDLRLAGFYAEQLRRRPADPHRGPAGHPRREPTRDPPPARPARTRPVPRELPPDVRGFTGRAAALNYLDGLVAPDTGIVVISAIDGVPGVGKTALAVHFAHRVTDRFPDGQLHVDLRGFDPDRAALSPGDVLARFLPSLGLDPAQIPADLDERADRYRSLLAGRRILLLLDNASTAEQVRPLLPGTSGCLAVVTSRNRLSGLVAVDGAHRITVDVLTATESLNLLAGIAGRERIESAPGAAAELARLAGYLPLALRIVGARLSSRPRLGLGELVGELAEARNRLDVLSADGDERQAVRAILSWSYRLLPPDAARLFRLLSLHAGPDFTSHPAAALADSSVADGRRLLDTLAAGGLLEPVGRDRFRFHDLVRVYAAERAGADEPEQHRATAVCRMLAWYLHTAHASSRAMHPGFRHVALDPAEAPREPVTFRTYADGVRWHESERANLAAAIRQAAGRGEHAVAWTLSGSLTNHYFLGRHWSEGLDSYQVGLSSARRTGDPFAEAWMLTCLGSGYLSVGRLGEALDEARAGLARWRELGDRPGETWALTMIAGAHLARRQVDLAIDACQRAVTVARDGGDPWGEAYALNHLAATYQSLRHYDEVVECGRRALAIWRGIGNPYGVAWSLHTLGTVDRRLGRLHQAIDRCRESVAIRREIGDRSGEAAGLLSLGKALRETGEPDQARQAWVRARLILEELGDRRADAVRTWLDTRL
jgi:tetratricopeptide (TPR) repeat protein